MTGTAKRAVIDIGSNSILLLVAERGPHGHLEIERDEAEIARLCAGVSRRGTLDPDAIARALEILRAYERECGVLEIVAVATEGLRMARDPEAFLVPAEAVLGVPITIISGREEAELSYRSVALEVPETTELCVIDIGGASTEIVCGRGLEIVDWRSHAIGSVRLFERFVAEDPPTRDAIEAVAGAARVAFAAQPIAPRDELVGLAGTVTTCAALLLELDHYERERVDGTRFSVDEVRRLRDALAKEPLAVRQRRPCLPAGRADVIVVGLTILLVALEHVGATTLVVRDRGLRYALV